MDAVVCTNAFITSQNNEVKTTITFTLISNKGKMETDVIPCIDRNVFSMFPLFHEFWELALLNLRYCMQLVFVTACLIHADPLCLAYTGKINILQQIVNVNTASENDGIKKRERASEWE